MYQTTDLCEGRRVGGSPNRLCKEHHLSAPLESVAHCGIRSNTVWIYHAFVQICQENCSASARIISSELFVLCCLNAPYHCINVTILIDLKMTCDRGQKATRQEFVSGPPSPPSLLPFSFVEGEGEGGLIAGYINTSSTIEGLAAPTTG